MELFCNNLKSLHCPFIFLTYSCWINVLIFFQMTPIFWMVVHLQWMDWMNDFSENAGNGFFLSSAWFILSSGQLLTVVFRSGRRKDVTNSKGNFFQNTSPPTILNFYSKNQQCAVFSKRLELPKLNSITQTMHLCSLIRSNEDDKDEWINQGPSNGLLLMLFLKVYF